MIARPRLLIDENLSVELPGFAHRRGYQASHVRDLGLLSKPDRVLLDRARAEDWTLVTGNIEEFRARYRQVPLHAGVVFLAGFLGVSQQRAALSLALDDIDRNPDLTNVELLVEPHGQGARVRRFDLP